MSRPISILLVEDDETDTEAVRRVLRKAKVSNPLTSARDGVEALEHLNGLNGREKLPQPCLVLLDINMPRMNGFQLLHEMNKDEHMKKNIIFMLTTSGRPEDRVQAYSLNVAGYVMKENLPMLARILGDYFHIPENTEEVTYLVN